MFDFTTLTVLNSIITEGKGQNVFVIESGDKKPQVRIGNVRFNSDNIECIYEANPTDEVLAKVEFDLTSLIAKASEGDVTGRIVLYLGLSMGSQDSFYANDMVYKGKPVYIEFPVKSGTTAEKLAKKIKSIADKYMLLMANEKFLDVEVVTTPGENEDPDVTTLVITGVNGYQQIKVANLQWFNPEAKTVDCCTNQGEFEDLVVGVPVAYEVNDGEVESLGKFTGVDASGNGEYEELDSGTEVAILPGIEAFGDYNWMIHNLRLPTSANTDFWSANKAEMPVVGGQYTQFTVTMKANRDKVAGEVVGQRATSVTTHVFYVLNSGNNVTNVRNALKKVNNNTNPVVDADTKHDNPYPAEA